MNYFKSRTSIRNRLTRITMTVIILITVLFILFCVVLFKNFLHNNLLQYTQLNLALLSENISAQMINLEFMVKECASQKSIIDYFESEETYDTKEYDDVFMTFYQDYSDCASHQFVNHMILCDYTDSSRYLQIAGNHKEVLEEPLSALENAAPLILYKLAPKKIYIALGESSLDCTQDTQVITIIQPIGINENAAPDAFLYLEVSADVITDYIANYNMDSNSHLFLTIGNQYYELHDNDLLLQEAVIDHEENTLFQNINFSDWSLVQTMSPNYMLYQADFFMTASIVVIIILLIYGIFYSIYLQKLIVKPIDRLSQRIAAISQGDFSFDPDIEWPDELGDIGRGINTMSMHIATLMDKRVADQKEKSDLEYEMLLNQMTPHFVYNTLNTIRWMAIIQNAEGISEMTSALARLMKNISKLPNTPIPVRKEFELINDYFTIIKLRYGNTITLDYHILDPAIQDCMIVKFTLQPLVENAIFHGIEPKQKTGIVTITAGRKDADTCYIEITDDGIGITPDRIEKLLSEDTTHTFDGLMKHMGLYNVNKRLQYTFGHSSGLSIISELGVYTKVTVTLPFTTNRPDNDKS